MIRRYLFAVLILMIIGGMIYSYQKFKRFNTPVSPILTAVPEGSALVLETANALDLWEKLTHTSVIWEDLKQTNLIGDVDAIGQRLDSILRTDPELEKRMINRKTMVVVAPSGADRYSLLFGINTPTIWKDLKVQEVVQLFLPENAQTTTRDYTGTVVYSVSSGNRPLFHWARKSGVLLLCAETIPLENALRTMDAPVNITTDPSFDKIGKTAGLYADANVYINYGHWSQFLSTLLNNRGKSAPFFKHGAAGWSALDLTLLSDEIMLNGFVHVPDSAGHYFNIFAGQNGREPEVTRIIPSNTAYLLFYGLSHFPTYYQRYQELLRRQQEFFRYDQRLDEFNQRIGGNAADFCLSWIGSEMAVFITEPGHVQYDQLAYLALQTADTEEAVKLLGNLSEALGTTPEPAEVGDYASWELELGNVYGLLLGVPFDGFERVFVTAIDDYVVMAQSKSALRNLLNFYATENTLARDNNFQSFTENLGKRSNLLLYSGISRSPQLYSPFLRAAGEQALNDHLEIVRNFEGFAYQIVESDKELFYNNIYLRHNPVYTRESGAFWELAMDTAITSGPQLVLNHYTQSREIVVQDAAHNLYLISNTGKVLWSKKVSGEILGKVQQIDLYKNNKLQLLFNTRDQLYLVDRNGNDVDGYPVKLSSPATAALGLFDYDDSRDYRILISTENRQLSMYDGHGKAVQGWKSNATENVVRDKPQHLRLGTKDYIFTCDQGGNIYLLNRQGKPRHRVKSKIEARSENPVFISEGKNIKNCALLYTDTLGNLVSVGFDETVSKTKIFDPRPHQLAASDLNNNERLELIITTAEEFFIFDHEGDEVCSYEGDGLNSAPVVFRKSDGGAWVGVRSTTDEAIYILDDECRPNNNFPLFARGNFTFGDINKDGVVNVVAVGEPNVLYTYNLE